MDLKRSFAPRKFWSIITVCVILCFLSVADDLPLHMKRIADGGDPGSGAVNQLHRAMLFDTFKVIMVFAFSGLYTNCFCRDESECYLRMILCRVDSTTYSCSKFLANLLTILCASVLTFLLAAIGYMLLGYPFISDDATKSTLNAILYKDVAENVPLLYLLMMALQFGMITAACSSVGLLYSAYQPESFISIGASGLVFFLMLSLSMLGLNETPFNLLELLGMRTMLPGENPVLAYAWGMMYPLIVIVLCCMKFEKRMKWRAENGII